MKLPPHIESRVTWNDPPKTNTAELPTIKSIEPIVRECELGCGKIVDQHQGVNICKRTTPVEYWQRMCKVCKQFQNPSTGAYDCSLSDLNAILRPSLRKKHK
jgi:hypothetical protein|tara:strand:+ start:599 stop:904 length:306 start_codon:yes stop_codon:yes gene_type:complete